MEEMIDIYDENRQRMGITVPRAGAFMKEGQFVLYVLAVIQDQEGRILITQRALDKSWGAGWWEITGGGVLSGEDTVAAVRREVGEEVGLDVSGLPAEVIYTYKNVDLEHGSNYMVDIFRFQLDFTADSVTLQESEAVDAQLVTWEDIVALHEQGIFLHFDRLRLALGK